MKQRIISAAIVLAILITLLLIGGTIFKIFVLIVAVLGLKEMLDIRETKYPIPLLMKLVSFLSLIFLVVNTSLNDDLIFSLDYRVITLIIFAFLMPVLIYNDSKTYNINDGMFLIGTVIFLGLVFNIGSLLRDHGIMHIAYLLIITITTDTYAYFAGVLAGKHKLIERVSPGKTWEGTIVGTIFGVLISVVFYYIAINDSINIWQLIACTTALSIFGQIGDLVFSAIKRYYNKKDFSNIMPGHGGVLDRIDSLSFVILGYVLFMSII
jgi:phosphatidate cytidylyltransferase